MSPCPTSWPPSQYRWRPLLKMTSSKCSVSPFLVYHAAKFGSRRLLKWHAVTLPLYTRTQDLDAKWILHLAEFRFRGQEPPKMYAYCTSSGDGQTSCNVWLTSVERRRCSNEQRLETRWNLLGYPKLTNHSQALVGRSWPYCEDMWTRYCRLASFFPISISALIAKK